MKLSVSTLTQVKKVLKNKKKIIVHKLYFISLQKNQNRIHNINAIDITIVEKTKIALEFLNINIQKSTARSLYKLCLSRKVELITMI
jgi:hypothetical protein